MQENFLTSLIIYGEDSLRNETKNISLELEEQYKGNKKFRRVLTLVFHVFADNSEIFELSTLKPCFLERQNFSFEFREFILDKYIEWRNTDPNLENFEKLYVLGGVRTKEKLLWVELVKILNSLSLKIEEFHVLLQKTNQFVEKYHEILEVFEEDYLIDVVKLASKFLFSQKYFKECERLLTIVLQNKEVKTGEYAVFEKLMIACGRATSDKFILPEIEEVSRIKNNKSSKKKPNDKDDVAMDLEEKVLSSSELAQRMEQFEKLNLPEQIDKADSYLLSYLLQQRT